MALDTTTLVVPGFKTQGTVAIDFGGSLIKLAYFPNKTTALSAAEAALAVDRRDDVLSQPAPSRKSAFIKPGAVSKLLFAYEKKADETIKQNQATKGKVSYTVRLVSLESAKAKEVVDIISENCELQATSDGRRVINVTGFGSLKAWQYLEQKLNVKLRLQDEGTLSVRGFQHLLTQLGPEDFLEQYPEDVMEQALKEYTATAVGVAKMKGQKPPKIDEKAPVRKQMETAYNVNFDVPRTTNKYLLLSLGSGAITTKVIGNDVKGMVDVMFGVGKSFCALGKLITGKQSFDELIGLALRGNAQNVNTVLGDAQQTGVKDIADTVYNSLPSDAVCYYLGKVMDPTKKKEDFKPEDIMAGLLDMTCQNIVQRCYHVAIANGVDYVFFTGGFVDNAGVRRVMSRFALLSMMGEKKKVNFHFPKYASYIEAIGGLLTPIDPEGAKKDTPPKRIAVHQRVAADDEEASAQQQPKGTEVKPTAVTTQKATAVSTQKATAVSTQKETTVTKQKDTAKDTTVTTQKAAVLNTQKVAAKDTAVTTKTDTAETATKAKANANADGDGDADDDADDSDSEISDMADEQTGSYDLTANV